MPLVGQQLGQYRLLKLINSGNKSDMYQAESVSHPQQVIVVVMSPDPMSWSDRTRLRKRLLLFAGRPPK